MSCLIFCMVTVAMPNPNPNPNTDPNPDPNPIPNPNQVMMEMWVVAKTSALTLSVAGTPA